MKYSFRHPIVVPVLALCFVFAAAALGNEPVSLAVFPEKKPAIGDAAVALVEKLNSWLDRYSALPPKQRARLEPLAGFTAYIRRPAMKYLIMHRPETALELSFGHARRANLPGSAQKLLEEQIDGIGDVHLVGFARNLSGQDSICLEVNDRVLLIEGREYLDPSVYGRRLIQPGKEQLPVHGIAIDGRFAWLENPYRLLDELERLENQIPINAAGVRVGDKIITLENPDLLADLERSLIRRESIPGPFVFPDPVPVDDEVTLRRAWTNGPKSLLWVAVDFIEAPGSRFTRSATTDLVVAEADEWLRAISRDRTNLNVTYFPGVLRLPAGSLARANMDRTFLTVDAIRALADYDASHGSTGRWLGDSWDRVAILVSDAMTQPDGSINRGAFSADQHYLVFHGVTDRFYMHHELGHTYFCAHADYFQPSTADLAGPGIFMYGMWWDYMGQGFSDQRSHPMALNKKNAYWFDDSEWIDASAGGTFYLGAHDTGPPGIPRGLLITTDGVREYWVDMRRLWTEQPLLSSGVQIHYWERRIPTEEIPVSVVATARARSARPPESAFQAGDVFTDTPRGVRIRVRTVGLDPLAAGVHYAIIEVERF